MTTRSIVRRLTALAVIAGAAALSGCATLNSVSSQVASFGEWPGDKVPGTYTFDRLPSQQKNVERQDRLEAAASQALQTAGFKPADEGAKGQYTIQLGARIERTEPDPWDDPLWMPGFYRRGFYGPYFSPFGPYGGYYGPYGPWGRPWGAFPYPTYYDEYQREVALLIRDTESGKPLYETRAVSTGSTTGGDRTLAAMFTASLKEFPKTNERAHNVAVELPLAPQP